MGNRTVKVVGHRGASTDAPENTMASFRRALDLGADGIEFDVHETIDGHAVVMHDVMLDRTSNGSGPVFEATFDEVRSLDAGSWFSPEFAGAQVPTLDEVLALPVEIFELEIKTWGRSILDLVLAAVDRAGVMDRVKFTGWSHTLLLQLKAERPEAKVGLFSQVPQPWMNDAIFQRYILGTAETAGFDAAHVYASALTEPIANGLRNLGYIVHANNAVDRDDIQRAVDLGAYSLSADDVALALTVVEPGLKS